MMLNLITLPALNQALWQQTNRCSDTNGQIRGGGAEK
jgi:hypothetical protein